jgi:hypothetical protein
VVPANSKYADSKSSAYLRGTWLKTKKYQTVILAYLRYVSTRIITPMCIHCFFSTPIGNLVKPSGETLGALDLGGGSAQIVFKPMSKVSVGFSLSMTLCVNW